VSPVLCKDFEFLIIDEKSEKCYTPYNPFDLKKGLGRNHTHHLIANLLLHAEENNKVLHFAELDLSRAFETGRYLRMLLTAYKSRVNISLIQLIHDMFALL